MSTVISFRIDELSEKQLQHVYKRCIENANKRGDTVQENLLNSLSMSTFAKIVFYTGLDYVAADLDAPKGVTTTPLRSAK